MIAAQLGALIGADALLTGDEAAARFGHDWTGQYRWRPAAVARPRDTDQVRAILTWANTTRTAIVPVGGHTGLNGATFADGAVMVSLDRMRRIRDIRPAAAVMVAEAGVTLHAIHEAAAPHGLAFPLTFGARGSAQVGGFLSTNAGGSNVLAHGNARALCLGLEVVLADGRLLNLQSALRKDNTGYDLRDLFIGAEGTLGIITAATLALKPAPAAHATALIGMDSPQAALEILSELRAATNGTVEAFEYMPAGYMARLTDQRPDLTPPFAHPANILVELAGSDEAALRATLEGVLERALTTGTVHDAVIAQSQAQRARLWAMREAAAEITLNRHPLVDTDIALPLDLVGDFLTAMQARLAALDPGADELVVAHLGDGNIHYTAYPSRDDAALSAAIKASVADLAVSMGGTFSAEHGIGLAKRAGMAAHKDPVALSVMAAIKAALDPLNLMNPGKLLP
ncbi:FAD-binding oxidoreductase [Paracoccus sp. p3-h83]|uniref:FAD-binding oxidoreductase n=1 Tax=Paracoccus sp. p3-h83 TaxID=3342805 RepID=UPI0035BA680D